jgi:hypothetical protein
MDSPSRVSGSLSWVRRGSVAVIEGETRPYDDSIGDDGLLRYRYRGTDPRHPDNVGLRLAMQQNTPLIYFHGVVPGLYLAEWPVYVVGDAPTNLTFTVSVDDRRFASLGAVDESYGTSRTMTFDEWTNAVDRLCVAHLACT